ncbi:MAG: SLBB domain-containing protein [Candidatus Poribacteria bacterium]|nr:SLBB domain-containing protein [Candidatus Poribacteria bacterium]
MNFFICSLQVIRRTSRHLQAITVLLLMLKTVTLFGDVYRIRNGDNLLIAVIGQPEYNQSVQVRDDGRISYFGGDLQVAGMTTEEINTVISDFLLKEELVSNPVIMVSLVSQENAIYVGGAVKTPGRYVISPESDIDLYRAITLAGGMSETADVKQVQLIRFNTITHTDNDSKPNKMSDESGDATVKVDLFDLSTNQTSRNIRVYINDLVYVQQLSVIEVQGEVKTPGKLFVSNKISVADALARAGGFTQEADMTALVKVNSDGTLTELSVTEQFWKSVDKNRETISLTDGEVLFVPNAFKVEPIYVTGYVRTPGAHRVRGPLTLQKAIALAGGFENEANRDKVHIHRTDGTTIVHRFKPGIDSTLLFPGDIMEVHKKFLINWGIVSTAVSTIIAATNLIIYLTRD